MKSVSLLELRRNTAAILQRAREGQRMILTLRGKPVMRLEPLEPGRIDENDPFYRLADKATKGGAPLSNRQMDKLIYGA